MDQKKTDIDIQQDVARELAWDTRVSPTEIGIGVKAGVVTVSGTVDSWAKLRSIEEAVHRVKGVHDVASEIVVKLPGSHVRTDTDIAQTVRRALELDVMVPDELIETTVSHGIVTLEGRVPLWSQKYDTERAVERLAGVKRVRNHIEIHPAEIVDLGVARAAIETALERHATREATHVQLTTANGTVTVQGTVATPQERRAILGALRATKGVRDVEDCLHVA
jgi:osmotically-inducible protein OsmY